MKIAAGQRIGPYELVREAGRGGMSVVYEAEDTRDGHVVALKVLATSHQPAEERDALFARLQREARVISTLNHPGIVQVFEVGTAESNPWEPPLRYMAMEYLQGESLAERIKRGGAMPLQEAASLVAQIAGALDAIHRSGVVHRDVKPGNIMLLPDGSAKLMDFGIARLNDDTLITRPGTIVGSPAFMSPEQARGESATPASDLWSLAVVLYAMLAGHAPFRGENIPSVLYQIMHQAPPPIPGIPGDIQKILNRALDPEPAKRYPNASAMASAFLSAVAAATGEPITVSSTVYEAAPVVPGRLKDAPVRRQSRKPLPAFVPVAAVSILALGFGALLYQRGAFTPSPPEVVSSPAPVSTPDAANTGESNTSGRTSAQTPNSGKPIEAAADTVPSPTSTPTPAPTPAPTATPVSVVSPADSPSPEPLSSPAPAAIPPPTGTGKAEIIEEQTGKPADRGASETVVKNNPSAGVPVTGEKPAVRPGAKPAGGRPAAASPTPPPFVDAAPSPAPTPTPRPLPAPAKRPTERSPEPKVAEALSFRGIWNGKHTGNPAQLNIKEQNTEADRFSGTLTVTTPEGTVVIEVRGRLDDSEGEPMVVLEEKRIIEAPGKNVWDLGSNRGYLAGPNTLRGNGKDKRGRTYTWNFVR
ncbi:MAG: hypothetical protein OHK0029_32860 [Armatimonadaceae bacterium]